MRTEHEVTTHAEATTHAGSVQARVGDWLEARSIHGGPSRRGEVVEILGSRAREHYLVRWEEDHESIVYPDDGVTLVRHGRHLQPARH